MSSLYSLFILVSLSISILAAPTVSTVPIAREPYGPIVDLGYEIYQGKYDQASGLNRFLGMRYAQDTSGPNRWQAPKTPLTNRERILSALALPPRCPQGPNAPGDPSADFTGTEDCLFLSVVAPANAQNLPVLVSIHGGGYGQGQGSQDLTPIITANNNSFIGVVIQYRLAAFGFLSSDEVQRFGTPNAGILDQHFTLQWVQKYIHLFGGDPRRVTITGESAGGGSVMLLVMANGGEDGTQYFEQAAAQSPYLPLQYDYNAFPSEQSYYAFAAAAGCYTGLPYGNATGKIFDCLVSKPSDVLQQANSRISGSGNTGTWAFLPVTDGSFIRDIPSRQLAQGKVNGAKMLSGNNANEGAYFVPNGINTEADFIAYLKQYFPLLDNKTIDQVLAHYPVTRNSGGGFATNGTGGPGATALDTSQFATGQQQRAYNLYGELTFVCPSYWLPEAFTQARSGGYKYQFSPPPSLHADDQGSIYGPKPRFVGPDLFIAFRKIFSNFILTGNPSISSSIANGASNASTAENSASSWPTFSLEHQQQINLNETGGVLASGTFFQGRNTTYYSDPGKTNAISLVNAGSWEGGRGARCEFWRSIGSMVPV